MLALRALAISRGMRLKVDNHEGQSRICIEQQDKTIIIDLHSYFYALDMINAFDYYFDSVEYTSKENRKIVDYSQPADHVLKPSGCHFRFTSLPESDKSTLIYLEKAQLKPGDVVLDLGAYCGATACAFSRTIGPTGRVIAFEPDPKNYTHLVHNIHTHNAPNIIPINKGLWSKTATLKFQAEGNMGSSVAEITGRHSKIVEIPVISLDEAVETNGVERLDFVKMDIEGAEEPVLASASRFWKQFKPDFIIEPHLVNGRLSSIAVCKLLEDRGYQCSTIPQAGLSLPLIYATAQK